MQVLYTASARATGDGRHGHVRVRTATRGAVALARTGLVAR